MSTSSFCVNRNYVPLPLDCIVPPGATVLELKCCENCTRIFVRPRAALRPKQVSNENFGYVLIGEEPTSTIYVDTGERFCMKCRTSPWVPAPDKEKTQEYKDQFPTKMQARTGIPHYDSSLAVVAPKPAQSGMHKMMQRVRPVKRKPHGFWSEIFGRFHGKVFALAEILQAAGVELDLNVYPYLAKHGYHLKQVGNVWPRKSCMGSCPKLYRLVPS